MPNCVPHGLVHYTGVTYVHLFFNYQNVLTYLSAQKACGESFTVLFGCSYICVCIQLEVMHESVQRCESFHEVIFVFQQEHVGSKTKSSRSMYDACV